MAKSYTPAPQVPAKLLDRYQVILEVLSGELTVSEGARRLGLSRNHFQTLMHRGLSGFLEALQGKPSGRPPAPESERKLRAESERLRRENERLKKRVESTDRVLGLASGLLRGRMERGRKRSDDSTEGG